MAGLLCATGGAMLTGRTVYLRLKAVLAEHLIRRAWRETLRSGRATRPWPWADTHPVGRLTIPAIGYDEMVLEGASGRALAFGPGRMEHGAELGRAGNVVLAGHRTSWFRPLERVRQGQWLRLEWADRAAHRAAQRWYRVESIRVVDPEEVGHLAPTTEDVLTLVTCYPFGRGRLSPKRYVVRAVARTDVPPAIASVPPAEAGAHTIPHGPPGETLRHPGGSRGPDRRDRMDSGFRRNDGGVGAYTPDTSSHAVPDTAFWYAAVPSLSSSSTACGLGDPSLWSHSACTNRRRVGALFTTGADAPTERTLVLENPHKDVDFQVESTTICIGAASSRHRWPGRFPETR